MATYKYRHQEVYKDVSIDIKAKSSGELIDKVKKKKDQIDRQYMDKDTTLGDFIDKYLETYKQHTVAPDTYNYCESLGRKISNGIGSGRKVSKIKPMQVQSFLNDLTDYKDSYIKRIYQMTCRIFQHAYRNGLTTTDYSVVYDNCLVVVNRFPSDDGYPKGFEHITGRDYSKDKTRYPDFRRSERIGWIKPMIEESTDICPKCLDCDGIKIWERPYKNRTRTIFLSEEESYVVILEKKKHLYMLITAFYIDEDNEMNDFLNSYEKYKN